VGVSTLYGKKIIFGGKVGRIKPESHGDTTFRGGLEGLRPSICAAGATPTTNPVNFRRIQRRKERS
jgi:hypothetical protein